MYDPELFCLYFFVAVGLAVVLPELPFYPDRVVVGQLHCMMEVCIPAPPRQTEVAICALGSFWLGA